MPEVDAEDLALEKRRYVYKYGLYVKHVATNRFTRVSILLHSHSRQISESQACSFPLYSSGTIHLSKLVPIRNSSKDYKSGCDVNSEFLTALT